MRAITTSRKGKIAVTIISIVLCIAVALMTISCYGKFPVTKAVYRVNGDVSDEKIVKTLVFWGMIILPVYELSMLGDAIVFNLIEFWTGEPLHL